MRWSTSGFASWCIGEHDATKTTTNWQSYREQLRPVVYHTGHYGNTHTFMPSHAFVARDLARERAPRLQSASARI